MQQKKICWWWRREAPPPILYYSLKKKIEYIQTIIQSCNNNAGSQLDFLRIYVKIADPNVIGSQYDQWLMPLQDGRMKCLVCAKEFTTRWNARTHYREFHSGLKEMTVSCYLCSKIFRNKRYCNQHLRSVHGNFQRIKKL